jgi:lysozyme
MISLRKSIVAGLILFGGTGCGNQARECSVGNAGTVLPRSNGSRCTGDAFEGKQALAPSLLFIKKWEGWRSTSYKDQGGRLTIGWGRCEGVFASEQTTKEREEVWLRKRIESMNDLLNARLHRPISTTQRTAMLSLIYNVGFQRVLTSRGWIALNRGNYSECSHEWFSRERGFVKCGGKFSEGLARRRAAERLLFEKGE